MSDEAVSSKSFYEGSFERVLVKLNRWLLIIMAGVMVVLVFLNVVCRYIFNFSIIWAEEVSQYLMVWVAFLGAGLALLSPATGRGAPSAVGRKSCAALSLRRRPWIAQ